MNLIIWILIFTVSLYVLMKGADWFIASAEKIGFYLGLSPFIIGMTIIAIGTSFPELFTAIAAGVKGVTELIPASVIGSNIANILLIVGIAAVIGGKLTVSKNPIDIELPLLSIGTVILFGVIWPWGETESVVITRPESMFLVLTYLGYFFYMVMHKKSGGEGANLDYLKQSRVAKKDWFILIGGVICLALGAKFLVDSVIEISEIIGVGIGVISIITVAVGTSLPELVVSVKAALNNKPEIAIGNIFGSNAFNSLIVIGIPGIFTMIQVDDSTFTIGLPLMIMATFLFVTLVILKRIHRWEGIFFLSLYILFIAKLMNIF